MYEPLRSVGKKIKSGIVVEEEVLWVAVLRLDHVWTLNRVAAEKDGLIKVISIKSRLFGSVPEKRGSFRGSFRDRHTQFKPTMS